MGYAPDFVQVAIAPYIKEIRKKRMYNFVTAVTVLCRIHTCIRAHEYWQAVFNFRPHITWNLLWLMYKWIGMSFWSFEIVFWTGLAQEHPAKKKKKRSFWTADAINILAHKQRKKSGVSKSKIRIQSPGFQNGLHANVKLYSSCVQILRWAPGSYALPFVCLGLWNLQCAPALRFRATLWSTVHQYLAYVFKFSCT